MLEKNIYYGTEDIKSLSYLEFGSIDLKNANKKVWGYWHDQKAYDLYMFARYAKDLFIFKDFIKKENPTFKDFLNIIKVTVHDKLYDYIFKYAGIKTYILMKKELGGSKRICESGSSLLGIIDELQALDLVVNDGLLINDIEQENYLASDISIMMNKGAKLFHPRADIHDSTAGTISDLLDENNDIGLLYGLSVSLRYAFRNADDMRKVVNACDIAIFNRLSMSYKEDTMILAGTGKETYILSVNRLKEIFRNTKAYVLYNTNSIQRDKDGSDSIRASLIISKNKKLVENFLKTYDNIIEKAIKDNIIADYFGEWKEFLNL